MKLSRLSGFICLSIILTATLSAGASAPARNYYQLKIYHCKTQAQETRLLEGYQINE